MKRKYLAVGMILLFIGTCIIPSATSEQTHVKRQITGTNIITVDDEPGDADFTSIKEAVNYSNPGDIIEVYSGTYFEEGIRIVKDSITLLGISHELGEGNDSGKPFIKGNGFHSVIEIEASHVIISNFTIENPDAQGYNFTCGIFIERHPGYEQNNITISDCNITNSAHAGIYVVYTRDNIRIINNHISHCFLDGINIMSYSPVSSFIIIGNVISDCRDSGICFSGADHQNVSCNRISNCSIGIEFGATNTSLYGNDIDNCNLAIRCGGTGNIITKNNFKNYNRIGFWFYKYLLWPGKNKWIGNYWDTWRGVGPKIILGMKVLEFRYIVILFPWVEFDWKPAKEPYYIP